MRPPSTEGPFLDGMISVSYTLGCIAAEPGFGQESRPRAYRVGRGLAERVSPFVFAMLLLIAEALLRRLTF
jgi:hypothetical protein